MATNGNVEDVLDPWANPFADDRSSSAKPSSVVANGAGAGAFDDVGGFGDDSGGGTSGFGGDGGSGGFGGTVNDLDRRFSDGLSFDPTSSSPSAVVVASSGDAAGSFGGEDEDARFAAVLAAANPAGPSSAFGAPRDGGSAFEHAAPPASSSSLDAGFDSSRPSAAAYPYLDTDATGGFSNGFQTATAYPSTSSRQQPQGMGYSPPLASILNTHAPSSSHTDPFSGSPLSPTPRPTTMTMATAAGVDDLLGDENAGGLLSGASGLKAAFKKREPRPQGGAAAGDGAEAGPSSPAKKAAMASGISAGPGSAAVASVKGRRKRGIVAATAKPAPSPPSGKAAATASEQAEPSGSAAESVKNASSAPKPSNKTTSSSTPDQVAASRGDTDVQGDDKGAAASSESAATRAEAESARQSASGADAGAEDATQAEGDAPAVASKDETGPAVKVMEAPTANENDVQSSSEGAEDKSAAAHAYKEQDDSAARQDDVTATAQAKLSDDAPPTDHPIAARTPVAHGEPGQMDLKTLPPLPVSEAGTSRATTPANTIPRETQAVAATPGRSWTPDTRPANGNSAPVPTFVPPPPVHDVPSWAPRPVSPPPPARPDTPPAPRPAPTFSISLSDPTKVGDPIRGHVVYTLTTHTTSPRFSRSQFTVLRRFSDFLWLFDALTANNPGVIVPPVPDKHLFGRFEETFIETRRAALERCLGKIANHPVLGLDPDLRMFLESDTLQRKGHEGATSANRLATTFTSMAGPKFSESDDWFDSKRAYVDGLESQLKTLVKSMEATSKQRVELVGATGELLDAVTELSECDLATDLTTALQRLAELTRREREIMEENARGEIEHVLSLCDEYIRLIGSIRVSALDGQSDVRANQTLLSSLSLRASAPTSPGKTWSPTREKRDRFMKR